MTSAETVLEVSDLHKTFFIGFFRRRVPALQGVTFEVKRGEILGFVGPNGAGKTTAIKTMLQLIFPQRGQVKVFGKPTFDPAARRRIGYLPENPYIYSYLKPLEFLDLCGQLTGLSSAQRRKRADDLLQQLGLADAADRPIGRFSKGMTQRLGFCQALLHEPELIILDEPFSGLDPIGRKDIRDLLLEQKAQGKTILLTSHVLSDVEALSERVAIIRRGKIVAYGAIAELLRPEVRRVDVDLTDVSAELLARLQSLAVQVRVLEQQTLVIAHGEAAVPLILQCALAGGARVLSVTPHRETLEDLFMRKALAESN